MPVLLAVVNTFDNRQNRMKENAVVKVMLSVETNCVGIIFCECFECSGNQRVVNAEQSEHVISLVSLFAEILKFGSIGLQAFKIM